MRYGRCYMGALAALLAVQPQLLGSAQPLSGFTTARGTSIAGPYPRILATPQGYFAMKHLPNMKDLSKPPLGVLFSLSPNGREHVLWKRTLLGQPTMIKIEDTWMEPFVITLGAGYSPDGSHFLVIYDSKGNVRSDFSLKDLLTPEEVANSSPVKYNQYALDWIYEAQYDIRHNQGYVSVRLKSGRIVKISLITGNIERG